MIPIKCRMGMCLKSQVGRTGYCEEHLAIKRKESFKKWRDSREDNLYNDHHYRLLRRRILAEHPLCVDCKRRAAQEIHHIVKVKDDPTRLCDETNVIPLCKKCHKVRTDNGE